MDFSQNIRCADCKQIIGAYDGKSTINKLIRCKRCKKYNIFDTKKKKTRIVEAPNRETSGGLTFY